MALELALNIALSTVITMQLVDPDYPHTSTMVEKASIQALRAKLTGLNHQCRNTLGLFVTNKSLLITTWIGWLMA